MTLVDIAVPADQAEGTRFVLRAWLKTPGSAVAADEPVAEIETDKVTMEVPAPGAGVLREQMVAAGTAVEPGMVIGRISLPSGGAARPPAADAAPRFSPSVRRLLAEHGCDPRQIVGTGRGGRITNADVLAYVERGKEGGAPRPTPGQAPASPSASGGRKIPHDAMRRAIADRMRRSLTAAPHVTAVFEADLTAVVRDRARRKLDPQPRGGRPTYTAYFVAACARAMQEVPVLNGRWHDDGMEIFEDINIGIVTALGNEGLVVPVIHRAQVLSLEEIAERLSDLTVRAKTGRLATSDVQGGTFTISNHGVSGSLLAAPIIIHQPQSAVLGVGKVEKRAVVRQTNGVDAIEIRPMAYVTLTIDHRVADAFQTNAWLTRFVEVLERWPTHDA